MSTPNQTPSEQDKRLAREAAESYFSWHYCSSSDTKAELENIILSAITKSKAGEQAKAWRVEKEGGTVRLYVGTNHYFSQNGMVGTDFFQDIANAHNATLTGEGTFRETEAHPETTRVLQKALEFISEIEYDADQVSRTPGIEISAFRTWQSIVKRCKHFLSEHSTATGALPVTPKSSSASGAPTETDEEEIAREATRKLKQWLLDKFGINLAFPEDLTAIDTIILTALRKVRAVEAEDTKILDRLEDPLMQLHLFGTHLKGGSPNELRNAVRAAKSSTKADLGTKP